MLPNLIQKVNFLSFVLVVVTFVPVFSHLTQSLTKEQANKFYISHSAHHGKLGVVMTVCV